MPTSRNRSLELRGAFLRKLFSRGEVYEELFRKLCKAGCNSDVLCGLLFAVCTIAVGDANGFIDLGA